MAIVKPCSSHTFYISNSKKSNVADELDNRVVDYIKSDNITTNPDRNMTNSYSMLKSDENWNISDRIVVLTNTYSDIVFF